MGIKIKNLQTGEFEKFNIPALKGEKGEPGEIEPSEKVDYIGKQHSKLRDTMNANVDYIIKTAIGEFNYLDYEGQHITATNSIEGHARSAILSGQTLVNLVDFKANFVRTTGTVVSRQGNKITFTTSTTGKFNLGCKLPMLKPNTKYLLKIKAESSLSAGVSFNVLNVISNRYLIATTTISDKIYFFTTDNVVDDIQLSFYRGQSVGDDTIVGEAVVCEYQDGMENWDIPYFEGMQSVKMPVLHSLNHHPFSKDGLVCWLDGSDGAKGDNMWIDRTGNGNNATLVNFNHNDLNGWTGDSLKFDGANAYCTLSPFVADSFTINMVVNITRGYGSSSSSWFLQGGLFDAEAPSVKNDFGLVVSEQGQIAAGIGNPDTTIRTTQTYLNKKVLISFVRDKEQGSYRLYINGELQAEGSCNNKSLSDPTQFILGAIATSLVRKPIFDCYSIMVYNRVLTPKEINMSTEYLLPSYVHKTNILTVNEPVELRGIGDVKDTLDCLTGEITHYIEDGLLDGTETWTAIFNSNSSVFSTKSFNIVVGSEIIYDKLPDGVNNITNNNGVLKVSTTSEFASIAVSNFIKKLKENPIPFMYCSNDVVIKTVDLSDNHVYSYKGTTYYSCSSEEGSLVPTLSVKVPTDTQLTIQEQKATTQTLLIKNMDLQQSIKEVQAMNLAFNTALYNSFNSIREEVEDIKKNVSTNENLEGSF